jgi:hypothetical protein
MTYQIIYSSHSTTPMQMDDLEDLLEHAQASNATQGITGALVYVEGAFLQVLEGDKAGLQKLMVKISRDLRHETVVVLREGDVPTAIFSGWNMAYVSATAEQVAQWAGFSCSKPMPQVLSDIQKDSHRAAQVTQSILAMLEPTQSTPTKTV